MYRIPWTVLVALVATLAVGLTAHPAGEAAPGPPVAVVGDSLTAGNLSTIRADFTAAGLGSAAFDAISGRNITVSINYSWGFVPSGVAAADGFQARGVDPRVWMVQLGANNLSMIANCNCDRVAFARGLILQMLDAIGDRTVAWVNVRASTSTDSVDIFNQALRDVAASRADLYIVDWHAYSAGKAWFADNVHPNVDGARALGRCMAASAAWLVNRPVAPTPASTSTTISTTTTSVVPSALTTLGAAASATEPAERMGVPVLAPDALPSCASLA